MRLIRTLLLLVLAIILVVLAFANRELVTVSVQVTEALPGFSVRLPLFLVILVTLMLGAIIGIVWEWIRNGSLRVQSAERGREITRLQREISMLRKDHADPEDEVIAILNHPKRRQTSRKLSPVPGLTQNPTQNPMPPALPAKP